MAIASPPTSSAQAGSGEGGGSRQSRDATTVLFLLLFWVLDAAIDAAVHGDASFYHSLLSPPPHEIADRLLVLLLAGCFILCRKRGARVRAALELALNDALQTAERERAKVVAVVETMADAISIQDPQLKVVYQNRAHQELAGRHVGEPCFQAYHGLSDICPECHLVSAFEDGEVHRVEMEMKGQKGKRWVEIMASALKDPDGRISAGIQVVRDTTDRKLAEQAVKKEAALLQHLIDTIPNPIYHQDLSGRFVWCNSAFAAWLQRPREQVLGSTMEKLAPAQVARLFGENEPSPEEGTVQELSLPSGDGEMHDVIFYKSMFSASAGEKAGVVGVIIDITSRKRAEKEAADLNVALMQQALELKQANRDLKAFSHAISHDLRTPLTRIYSSGQALEEYREVLDQNGKFFVKSVNEGCVQIEALLDALMALSRVTEATLACEPVDLSRMAREKASELQRLEPGRRALFRIAPGLTLQGDPKLLYLAVENLMHNAWKYTSRVPEAEIELGAFTSSEGEQVFFLKDNGAGFDPTRSEELFRPFHRLHTLQQFPGTGLGLATVRRIIRRHNGRIWCEGKPGGGATFYFTVNC